MALGKPCLQPLIPKTFMQASRAEAPSVQWANLAACHAALSWLAADEPGLARDALGDLGDRACRAVNEGDADDEHMTLQV